MVIHVLERASLIGVPVVLATTDDPADDELARTVAAAGYTVARGSRDDVLDRYAHAIPEGVGAIIRVTADCPFFDPAIGRAVLAALLASGVDYVSNVRPSTFPDGLDCSAITCEALLVASREATLQSEREHVVPFIWNHPDRFRSLNLAHERDLTSERWTVDDERDLMFARAVHERIGRESDPTSMYAVLRVLEREPSIRALNAGAIRDEGYARSLAADATGRSPV